eukprot:4209875-Lingulodinium_polyedra.AAC.1
MQERGQRGHQRWASEPENHGEELAVMLGVPKGNGELQVEEIPEQDRGGRRDERGDRGMVLQRVDLRGGGQGVRGSGHLRHVQGHVGRRREEEAGPSDPPQPRTRCQGVG